MLPLDRAAMAYAASNDLPDGLYERLIDAALAARLAARSADQYRTHDLEGDEAVEARRGALIAALRRELAEALEAAERDGPDAEVALYLRVLRALRGANAAEPPRPLRQLTVLGADLVARGIAPPQTGLVRSWLFTAGRNDPSLLDELRRELACVDHVDLLMAFIRWEGVRRIMDLVQQAAAVDAQGRPRTRWRILTTTYLGATELRAIDWLARQAGVELRISLDGRRSRLHAKAWLFRRATGYGSAYIGSANLTGAALTGGLEWTVKLTQAAEPDLFAAAVAHFETLWSDPEFTPYRPGDAALRAAVDAALARERQAVAGTRGEAAAPAAPIPFFALQPKPYQQAILERLAAERRHGRCRNLVVAATGTGKTVIAAFDYLATCRALGGRPRLLVVAHRVEILQQARATFIQVLQEPGFGTLCAEGQEPASVDHCFCTIQSLARRGLIERYGADYWHTVIIDECHHLAADSYRILDRLRPAVLLGLTATPERADGQRIDAFFDARPDGGPAAELRLWEALDQQLLVPFEYYGVEDGTDFSAVRWDQAGELADLDRLLTGNQARAETAIQAVERLVADPRRMRALAFCVSVAHARFMAERFRAHGWQAVAVAGDSDADERRSVPARLARGELQVVCTCDLYNEGIDIPSVDTLLLLRPTHSPVLIQQQLGRGLRLASGKTSCLIIDLVGRHRAEFRGDRILGILSGLARRELEQALEHGFGRLPPGCHIHLDRIPREQVLRQLREWSAGSWRALVAEARSWLQQRPSRRDASLADFLRDTGIELSELYRGGGAQQARGWAALRRACGLETRPEGPDEARVSLRIGEHLLAQDDPLLLATWRRLAEQQLAYDTAAPADQRRMDALAAELYPGRRDPVPGRQLAARLATMPALRDELAEVATWLAACTDLEPRPVPGMPDDWPFVLHARYHLRTICLFSGRIAPDRRDLPREGVIRCYDRHIEFLLVTLDKRGFSATTAYHDYAISPERFHWQSQNSAAPDTEAGRRYLAGAANGWTFQLFVRETTAHLYRALGPVTYESHEGERPMSIVWRLHCPLPFTLFKAYSVLRAG